MSENKIQIFDPDKKEIQIFDPNKKPYGRLSNNYKTKITQPDKMFKKGGIKKVGFCE